jgi:transcriptional regulator with XRE-family HTH domain
MTLGEKVKALRLARRWTQDELARRAHVRPALLSELEANKKIDTTGAVLKRLAWTLGVSVDYLVGMYEEGAANASLL